MRSHDEGGVPKESFGPFSKRELRKQIPRIGLLILVPFWARGWV